MTLADRAGLLVWPVLAAVIESASGDGFLLDGVGLAIAATAGAAVWLATHLRANGGQVALLPSRGCRRIGTSVVIEATGPRGRVRRWLWPGDLPSGELRRLRVQLECASPARPSR